MDERTVFFLGAGFTKAVRDVTPVGTELLTEAFEPGKPFAAEPPVQRARLLVEALYGRTAPPWPRIEDVLSVIDYAIPRAQSIATYSVMALKGLRDDLAYIIARVLGETSHTLNVGDIEPALQFAGRLLPDFAAAPPRVISTNYDVVLEMAISQHFHALGGPRDLRPGYHYGLTIREVVSLDPGLADYRGRPWVTDNRVASQQHYPFPRAVEGCVLVLKVHGSLNWLHCPRCGEIDALAFPERPEELALYPRARTCVNPHCTGRYEPVMVTPTMLKAYDQPYLDSLWTMAATALGDADRVVFVGYSLPEADYHLRSMMTAALAGRPAPPAIVVIDREEPPGSTPVPAGSAANPVRARYESLFGAGTVQFHPIGLAGLLAAWDSIVEH